MVILRSQNKITDFLMILAWASPFNAEFKHLVSIYSAFIETYKSILKKPHTDII